MSHPPLDGQKTSFRKTLNVHGFGFHYAVIDAIIKSSNLGYSWDFIGAEVPLTLNDYETHADLIFFNAQKNIYLVGECKRVDPALSEWCFARSAYSFGRSMIRPILDELFWTQHSAQVQLRPRPVTLGDSGYQVAVPVKSHQKGDGISPDRKAIIESVTQVLRAANAFTLLCSQNPRLAFQLDHVIKIVPAVFTTANLTKCNTDLSAADLASGDLPDSVGFEKVPWLWFQHPLNRSMQAMVQSRYVAEHWHDWSEHFIQTAVRSVAIVNITSADATASSLTTISDSF